MATGWQSPNMWRLKGAQRALKRTLEASRQLVLTVQFERLEREFQQLDRLSIQLAKDAASLPPQGLQVLANRVAGYYQRYGELERRLDAELKRHGVG